MTAEEFGKAVEVMEAERISLNEESEAIVAAGDNSDEGLLKYHKNQSAWQDWHMRLNLLKEHDPEYVE